MKKLTKREKAARKVLNRRLRAIYNTASPELRADTPYRVFRKMANAKRKAEGTSWLEAAKELSRSRKFTTAKDIGKENFLNMLKKDHKHEYSQMFGMMHLKKGEKVWDRLNWDDNKGMWTFNDAQGAQHWADISNSPKIAFIL